MDNLSFLLGLNANSGGGTATTPTWSEVENKPFESIDNETLVVDSNGVMSVVGSGITSTIPWNNVTSKPFSTVDTTTGLTIVDNTLMLETLDTVATIDYVDQQIDGVTTTLETDYALKSEIPDVSDFITASALTPYVEASALTTVAYSGSYNDLEDKPTIPTATSVTVTQGLTTGVTVGSIDVDGVTTTLYAPASSGADVPVEWGNSSKNSAILMNSNFMVNATGQNSVVLVSGQVYGQSGIALNAGTVSGKNGLAWGRNSSVAQNASNGMALGEGVHVQGSHSKAIGKNITMNAGVGDRIYIGDFLQDNANSTAPKFIRGQYNYIAYGVTYPTYVDLVGNGTADNARSNAEATDMSGNKFLAGDVYTNVTDWTDPINNSTKLVSGSVVGITNTLSTGTAIADIDIDGVTTTLYAPAGGSGGSTAWADITGKPNINSGTGTSSIIMGDTCVASMSYGVAQGRSTTAKSWAHAEGYDTLAEASYSHAEGERTEARGTASHTEGHYSVAYGNYSHAEGHETITGSIYQHAQGKYNIRDNDSQYADIVGNGTLTHRNNAEATDWDGNKYLAGDVYVGVTNWATPTLGSAMIPREADIDYAISNSAVENYEMYTDAVNAYSGGGTDPNGNFQYLGVSSEFSFKCELDEGGNKRYYWYCDSAEAVENPEYDPNAEPEEEPEEP